MASSASSLKAPPLPPPISGNSFMDFEFEVDQN